MSKPDKHVSNGGFAQVDDDVEERVNFAGIWFKLKKGRVWYVCRNFGRNRRVYLHHFLFGDGEKDHVNGDGLDNRLLNVRQASRAQNTQNRGVQSNNKCGLKGVYWHKQRMKWAAAIRHNGSKISLGLHSSPEEAHAAWASKAQELWGDFAPRRAMIDAAPQPGGDKP